MKFIHCSDIHLGKTLGENIDRYMDFFVAFSRVIELTIREKADFLLVAGDLFHEGTIAPSTLADTMDVLRPLKEAGIPVIAIEGNHDRFKRRKDESWLQFLSRMGYLVLLRPTIDIMSGTIKFDRYDRNRSLGGWIEINGLTIYGIGYFEASTAQMLDLTLKALPQKADIGIFHGGVWHTDVIRIGKVTPEEIKALKERFRYVALGHGHSPYQVEGFAFNPGSLEIVNREEANRENADKGLAYRVELTGDSLTVEPLLLPRRPFINMWVDVEGAGSPEEVETATRIALMKKNDELSLLERPVLMLDIVGKINFDSNSIEISKLEKIANQVLNPIFSCIVNLTSLVRSSQDYKGGVKDLDSLYRQTILDIVSTNPIYGTHKEEILELILDLKKHINDYGVKDPKSRDDIIDLIHKRRMKFSE